MAKDYANLVLSRSAFPRHSQQKAFPSDRGSYSAHPSTASHAAIAKTNNRKQEENPRKPRIPEATSPGFTKARPSFPGSSSSFGQLTLGAGTGVGGTGEERTLVSGYVPHSSNLRRIRTKYPDAAQATTNKGLQVRFVVPRAGWWAREHEALWSPSHFVAVLHLPKNDVTRILGSGGGQ